MIYKAENMIIQSNQHDMICQPVVSLPTEKVMFEDVI